MLYIYWNVLFNHILYNLSCGPYMDSLTEKLNRRIKLFSEWPWKGCNKVAIIIYETLCYLTYYYVLVSCHACSSQLVL